ncbi:MAG TPA: adenine phosphoribosyltransferase [Longimicrobiales bacterium]|nr:adenine phosphoribosyltransferase [Longimicrobiales bacterium]
MTPALVERLRSSIRDIPDFPKPGILFKDITPVLGDAALFGDVVLHLAQFHEPHGVDVVAGIESRGFIIGAPLALALNAGFVPFRKVGKLPAKTKRVDYALEYGMDALEAHEDAITPGQRVLVVDDVLATGGTAAAAGKLVQELGGELLGFSLLIELSFLNGRERLGDYPINAVLTY